MSYLISVVIIAPKEGEDRVNYACMGGFEGLNWHMSRDKPEEIRALNKQVSAKILKLHSKTTLERLKTAPVDEVIIIDGDTYSSMKHTPLDNRKGSIIVSEYLEKDIDQT